MQKWRSRVISRNVSPAWLPSDARCWFFAGPKECRPSSEICILIRPPVFKEQIVRRKSSSGEFHQPSVESWRAGARRNYCFSGSDMEFTFIFTEAPLGISINLATSQEPRRAATRIRFVKEHSSNVKTRFRSDISPIQFRVLGKFYFPSTRARVFTSRSKFLKTFRV